MCHEIEPKGVSSIGEREEIKNQKPSKQIKNQKKTSKRSSYRVAPPHTEQVVASTETQITAKTQEIRAPERLGEYVRSVVGTAHAKHLEFATVNAVPDRVEFNPNVLDLRMEYMILGQTKAGIVVTMNCGAATAWEVEGIEELSKEDGFMRGVV